MTPHNVCMDSVPAYQMIDSCLWSDCCAALFNMNKLKKRWQLCLQKGRMHCMSIPPLPPSNLISRISNMFSPPSPFEEAICPISPEEFFCLLCRYLVRQENSIPSQEGVTKSSPKPIPGV